MAGEPTAVAIMPAVRDGNEPFPTAESHPEPLGESAGINDIALSDDRQRIYAADSAFGLRIFDVSDPGNPRELSRLDLKWPEEDDGKQRGAQALSLSDPLALLFSEFHRAAIDVSDPVHPRQLAEAQPPLIGFTWEALILEEHELALLRAGVESMLILLDISSPTSPERVQIVEEPAGCYASSTLSLMHDWREGVLLINSCDATYYEVDAGRMLTAVKSYPLDRHAWSSSLVGDLLYVSHPFGGMQVIDLTMPSDAATTARLPADEFPLDHVAIGSSGLGLGQGTPDSLAWLAAEPGEPPRIGGSISIDDRIFDLIVSDRLAYVVVYEGIEIYELAPDTPPLLLSRIR